MWKFCRQIKAVIFSKTNGIFRTIFALALADSDFRFDRIQAYAELLEEEVINIPAWFSFTCMDGVNVVSGDSIMECASIADSCKQVMAIGINCTAPRFIHGLVVSIRKV